ncbi:glycogen/starch synthase [Shewanella sp. VB17]|uniref:glycogen synthase n=1 Tax=Shewanella sp. VB17 TaxID=2739432 RepID=UPI001567134E|nr:glycogen/starch synthase [Shewanella sp. VB17]NRD74967.1 glycogen/starch synthase [Shewanella sp. VB17]
MLAAENGSITGGKVGGMADVIRDLPQALKGQEVLADVIMPSYGYLAASAGAHWVKEISVPFAGGEYRVGLYLSDHPDVAGVKLYFLAHPCFVSSDSGTQKIYSSGCADRPFAEDASKFALFCQSVAVALVEQAIPLPDLMHLHDWHSGLFALLRAYVPKFSILKSIPCVFTIHNLALQGIRPLCGDPSSLEAWYPELVAQLDLSQRALIIDPRYPNCVNPMRVGINLCDRVHLVSPSYVDEVLLPSDYEAGFFGGEGLEADLICKRDEQALVGILNGCFYSAEFAELNVGDTDVYSHNRLKYEHTFTQIESTLVSWQGGRETVSSWDQVALTRLNARWRDLANNIMPSCLLTSVGRLTDQKMLILRQKINNETVLEIMLKRFRALEPNGLFVLLGSGDSEIAREFLAIAVNHSHFIFLNGYHEQVSEFLYKAGDLFIMPSSFEPCGISQLLSMREGQLCLVHGIGGLKDTVINNETGYVFNGDTLVAQGEDFLSRFSVAISEKGTDKWQQMQSLAKAQRFDWSSSARDYVRQLYQFYR